MTYDRLCLIDDESHVFTAKACEVISGGFLVGWFSGTDSVGSDTSTYAWDDIGVKTCATIAGSANCVGISLLTTGSGYEVPIACTGIYILPAGSNAVSGGLPVISSGYGNMVEGCVAAASGLNMPIGRAFTTATPLTGFAVVKLDV